MGIRSDTGTSISSKRGQSAILGIVLLIGMVATASIGIFFVADGMMNSTEQRSETERVEQSFVELSHQMATVTVNNDISRSMNLNVGRSGAIVKKDSGHINVTSDALNRNIDLTIGTIEYESDDGTVLAYEAGAVFRETGNETRVVSTPSIHYESETQTLTLPVSTVTGEQELGSGDVHISHNETTTFQEVNVVEDESVTISITSDYYRGWERFFRNEAGDISVREVDHENRTVVVEVGYIDLENAYNSGVTYSGDIDDFQDDFNDSARQGNMPEMDPVIEDLVEDAKTDSNVTDLGVLDSNETLSEGMYYADEVNLENGDSVTADLTDNATLVVDGDFVVDHNNAELTVDPNGENRTLRIYITGNFKFDNGVMKPAPSVGTAKAGQLQVYGTSQLDGHFHDGYFHGSFYAASEDWDGTNEVSDQCDGGEYQVCFHSNPEFKGSLVVNSTDIHAAAVSFEYDDSLQSNVFDAYPDGYTLPPQLTYLNVVKHEVEIEQD